MIENLSELVKKLASTSGRLEKEKFLAEYKGDEDVRFYLWFLYNPYIVTGISSKKLSKNPTEKPVQIDSLRGLLEYFSKNNTGRDIDVATLHAYAEGSEYKELIYALVKKDLKLGVQEKTLNKVFGEDFIPVLNVMLAESFWEHQSYLEGKEFVVSLKIDGVRALLMFSEGNPIFFTRQGRVIESLVELDIDVMKLNQDHVYDGELLLEGAEGNVADIYRATVRVTASDDEKRGLSFNIFDRVLKSDFVTGRSNQPCLERKTQLKEELERVGSPWLKFVPMLYVGKDLKEVDLLLDKYVDAGEEGIMVSPADSPYECKRTKNLLKVKKFHTADVLVVSAEEGTGANKGKLGAVHVKFLGPDGKEYTCKVGSGFKQDERELYWKDQSLIIGKIIEIGYFELSRNQNNDDYSLRFPTFKHVREDKTEISMH
ncbi:MAG: hypothetical protein FWE31_01390 [Firmicutes bacterium]|nr:hypothetical protein [Bacillota bacterium]